MTSRLWRSVLLASALALTACATNPYTERQQLLLLPESEDAKLGAQAYDQTCTLNGQPSVALSIYQLPGAFAGWGFVMSGNIGARERGENARRGKTWQNPRG